VVSKVVTPIGVSTEVITSVLQVVVVFLLTGIDQDVVVILLVFLENESLVFVSLDVLIKVNPLVILEV
jgi:hypothetical protein